MWPFKSCKVDATHAFLGGAYCSRFKKADGFYPLMTLEGILDAVIFKPDVYFCKNPTNYFHPLISSRLFASSRPQESSC